MTCSLNRSLPFLAWLLFDFVWHPKDDLIEVTPILLQVIKEGLDKEGIEIPFPQRVVTSYDPSIKS